jgi:3-oxoacyl-[acyl-carrier protein] reductase
MPRLEDRVIIVTGGAQGIGRAYCEGLVAEGASVVIADIDGKRAEALADQLGEGGAKALAIPTDVTREDATEQMARRTVERFGRIDGLINNAAMYQRPAVSHVRFEELSVDEWDRVMAVNLRGTFLAAKAVVGQMKQQRSGKIVNVSSTTALKGSPFFAHYVASKAGVIGFTRVLARELGEFNINVNALAPGLTASIEDESEEEMGKYQGTAQTRSLKRVEKPADLVGTAIFLCSSDSDFITGQTIAVEGGAVFN